MNDLVTIARVRSALQKTTDALLAELNPKGFWTGELSSSALSTAVAIIALQEMGIPDFRTAGLRWLAENQNTDGGWGDTIRSRSNISTTALCWAAFAGTTEFSGAVERAERWLGDRKTLPQRIAACYGKDKTFSVPILMTLALTGRIGWSEVPPLPFELAALPRSWFGAMQLPVVSYALPALIAIGQTIHYHTNSKNLLRNLCRARTLEILTGLQPVNGGFLEATPLTAFVTMSLAGMGRRDHPVAIKGASFLRASVRADGSWPIDTNLATWVTTLSIKALAPQPNVLAPDQLQSIREWLLHQQYRKIHPYTGAAPGGWAWTDLPGGVPDADDTAGALIALHHLGDHSAEIIHAAAAGVTWLLNLQNRDGGIPTFCRGWGALPFDQSAPELTAHALQAWSCWRKHLPPNLTARIDKARAKAFAYLQKSQRDDGSWIPLWFGNEHTPTQENPIYGTARTLIALEDEADSHLQRIRARAENFLRASTPPDSIEEAALRVEALQDALSANFLLDLLDANIPPAPIGLYFARLWYYERLYPLIFSASALGRIASNQR